MSERTIEVILSHMTKLRVGLINGKSKVVEFNKPYHYITASDIEDRVGCRVVGWVWIGHGHGD